MDPLTIAAMLMSSVPGIIQTITGAKQKREAAEIERHYQRPEATVAPAITEAVRYAKGMTFAQDIPGGEMYRNEIKGATTAGLKAASELGSGAEAYGMLGQLVGREQGAFADLARTTAEQVMGYKQNYLNTLPMFADEQNRVWNWNEVEPYLQAAATARQLRESGTKNVYSGIGNIVGPASETMMTSSLLTQGGFGKKESDAKMDEILKAISALKTE